METRTDQAQRLESIFSPVLSALARVVRHIQAGQAGESDVERVISLLETLPLPTDELCRSAFLTRACSAKRTHYLEEK